MAVPSSGELRLYADIGVEVGVPQSNVSLGEMSDLAGFEAPDSMSDFYGYTSYTEPTVTTNVATSVTASSMVLNGVYALPPDGASPVTERGFYFGTNVANPLSNTRYSLSGGTPNPFTLSRTGLNSSTTYYFWAFVVDAVQETIGSIQTIATNAPFAPTWASFNTTSTESYIRHNTITNNFGYFTKYYLNPDTSSYQSYWTGEMYFGNSLKNFTNINSGWSSWSGTNRTDFSTNTTNLIDFRATASDEIYAYNRSEVSLKPLAPNDFAPITKSWSVSASPDNTVLQYDQFFNTTIYIDILGGGTTFFAGQGFISQHYFNYN